MRPVPVTVMRKTSLMVAAALFIAVWASAQQATELHDAIAAALQAQEFEKALELLGPAIRQFPNDAQFWAMQGVAYEGAGNKKEALASFHRSLQISPDYLPALQGAAQIEYEAGRAAAIPLIQRVLRLRPNDRTGHGMLAVLEYQRGHCAAAEPHFEKAGSLFDAQVTALHAYGICLVRLKKFDHAVAVLQRAVAIQADDALERRLLASVQLMAAKPQDALETLKPLLQSDRTDPGTLELAATAYEDARETSQAVSTLRQAILLDPHNVNLYLDFAHICYAHDSFQVGVDVLSDGIDQQPTAAPLFLARGVLYVQLAEYQKAEADFERAHELDPRQSLSSAAQGVAALQENDLDRALATVQGKLSKKPNDALLLYLQADFLLQKGAAPGSPEFRIAMRSASKAVALQPSLAEAHTVLAKLYLQSRQYPKAIEQCRSALDSDPKNQAAVYQLIQALRKTGRNREIPDLLKRLAQLREQAAKEESHRNRYRLVEEESQPSKPIP
jgi:tetratricopeptide (TPR) repeat protein